jgi:hypothetical protein
MFGDDAPNPCGPIPQYDDLFGIWQAASMGQLVEQGAEILHTGAPGNIRDGSRLIEKHILHQMGTFTPTRRFKYCPHFDFSIHIALPFTLLFFHGNRTPTQAGQDAIQFNVETTD